MNFLKNFFNNEEGQDLVEYSLLLGFVALAAAATLTSLGGSLNGIYTTINTKVNSAAGAIH